MELIDLRESIYILNEYLFSTVVSEKNKEDLKRYIKAFSKEECEKYLRIGERLKKSKYLTNRRVKITNNAIKLFMKIYDSSGILVFPYIEKLATKGWDTKGGTYSFSMPLLSSTEYLDYSIYSFGPIKDLVSNKTELIISNGTTGGIVVDFIEKNKSLRGL